MKNNQGTLTTVGVRKGTGRTGRPLPSWRGSAVVAGKRYTISGWEAKDEAGRPMLSLRLSE